MEANASAVDASDPSRPVEFGFANLDPTTGAVQHISYTVGPFGGERGFHHTSERSQVCVFLTDCAAITAAARDAAAAAPQECAAAQLARCEALAAATAARKERQLVEILAHFDADRSGGLSYEQFVLFFQAMDSGATLTKAEFGELCESLEMAAAVGVTSLEAFFPESSDAEAVHKLHGRLLGVPEDLFADLQPSGGAGAAAAAAVGGRRDWRAEAAGDGGAEPSPEPELLTSGEPIIIRSGHCSGAGAGQSRADLRPD